MNIMFLTRSLNLGGAEHQMVLLACGLYKKGYNVSVAVLYPGGPFQDKLERAGVKVHELSKRHRWDVFGFLQKLYRLVKQENPDVLHGYHVVPNILTICLKFAGCKSRMIWGVRCSNMDLGRYDKLARITFSISCYLSKFADLIIANSRTGRDYHQSMGYPSERFKVVYNGIDTELFNINTSNRKRIRKEWDISDIDYVIGIVARIDPMKNYELFVKAANILSVKRKNVKFVCVGDGSIEYKNELYSLSSSLVDEGRLIWAGSRTDMPDVYNSFDLVTNCSHTEGFPNVVGEAMSSGKPCVVTDVGDSAYIVGDYGVVISSNSVESLVNAWEKAMDSNNFDSQPIRNQIVSNFSFDALIDNTEIVLKNECMN